MWEDCGGLSDCEELEGVNHKGDNGVGVTVLFSTKIVIRIPKSI